MSLQVVIIRAQGVNVSVRGGPQAFLDEIHGVHGLLWFLVEAHEDLGQLVDDTRLLKVFPEFFLLLLRCLDAHVVFYLLSVEIIISKYLKLDFIYY